MTAGATGDLVASTLGHESFSTTERHYARPEAVAAAQQGGALRELAGTKKSSRPFPWAA